jgi:two-component system sensor histidine kinase LytS
MLHPSEPKHSVDSEITWLQRYASILETRHARMLSFGWSIEDSARNMLVPRRLLQPLVENAALHGALGRAEGGRVDVRVSSRMVGGVSVVIADNGPGMGAAQHTTGLGLHLVRRRLELECPGSRLDVESSSAGTSVTVDLP